MIMKEADKEKFRECVDGKTPYTIARDLNRDAVPTAEGPRAWTQATVRALLMREGVHATRRARNTY
jgi:hypothetical protein